jgi:two-component system response regulator RstA
VKGMQHRILLVEDDARLAHLTKGFLQGQGFEVEIEARGDVAIERIIKENPDLTILDIMLPGLDGLSVIRKIRLLYKHPILILTARGDESDELAGLELGADEYIAKPVKPQLLLARIKLLLKRSQGIEENSQQFKLGSLFLDIENRLVQINGRQIDLTTIEYDLLCLFARNAGEVLSRDQINKALHGYEWDGLNRSIDLGISRLRRKLGDNGKRPHRIRSVRSLGYMLLAE